MPTGPWIVIVISLIALFSFILAPKKGILYRLLRQSRYRKTVVNENVLKVLYQLGEENRNFFVFRLPAEIIRKRNFDPIQLNHVLRRLTRQGYLEQVGNTWCLTDAGKHRAQRVVKIHRLWELYLTTYMRIAPDHVHDDAESIEHFLTSELEAELEQQLGYAKVDPHKSEIPYTNIN
jgi:manganese/zinc/iron transport system permease protein